MLETKQNVPRLIYVHCSAGCDRTGEFIGSYRLQFFKTNTTDMYAADTSECGRSPNWFGTSALEWFCLYLQATNGTQPEPAADCETFATCELFGKCHPTGTVPEDWPQPSDQRLIVTGRTPELRHQIAHTAARMLPGGEINAVRQLSRLLRGEMPATETRAIWERMLAKIHAQT